MISLKPAIALATLALVACGQGSQESDPLLEQATQIAQQRLIVDTHIDVPYALQEEYYDVGVASAKGDFDFPRARAGGLDIAFMSIYIPASYESDGARAFADGLIDMVEGIVAARPARFELVRSVAQARALAGTGRIGLPLGMENGAPIEGDLANLAHFAGRGIRYITLTHSESNHISDSSYDENRPWGGLSPFGERLVAAMNDSGVMIDVSHVSDAAFYDTLAITRSPVIASHSSARHFTPGFERNMDDAMIEALAANGGVIQINFGSSFITRKANEWYSTYDGIRDAWLEDNGFESDSDEARQFADEYRQSNPFPFADVEDVIDHIDHVRDLVGIEFIGLGSDFDGVGDSLPTRLKNVADYPHLVAGLLRRGYSEPDIAAILGENLLRVWSEVERLAKVTKPNQ